MPQDIPRIAAGQVIAMRLTDIAHEIDLPAAERAWIARQPGGAVRGRRLRARPRAVSFGVPPLDLELGPVPVELPGGPVVTTARATLYDFGIIALALRLPVANLAWPDFAARVNAMDAAVGPASATPIWPALVARLRAALGTALVRPTGTGPEEDYLLAIADRFETPETADTLLARADLPALLSGESAPLSAAAREGLLRHRFSWFPDDLAVITWDRAFLHDPRGDTDVADVLEIANAQLLEMRAYDEMLDAELPRVRALVDAARDSPALLGARRYARLARRLHALVAEVTTLAERVDNALQVTEDVYLARVYAAAMDLFRVPSVTAAVDRKLHILRDTYTALHAEAASTRAELLEAAILLLIAVEIVLGLLRH